MFTIKNEIQFDTAHYLSGYLGKCANIHGHRYRLIVKIAREELHTDGHLRGMVDDFSHIKTVLREVEAEFDHKLLVEDNDEGRRLTEALRAVKPDLAVCLFPTRPTVEEMSRYIFRLIRGKGLDVTEVELFETPANSCIYSE
ncbi:MAG: 6-carboxytetrahydropterin synthase [Paludibacteraceae bacterium]|nr:6-carboxytetrahydropterin synthase [Paludibacteraceae bacterium]